MAIPTARLISQRLHNVPGKLKVAELFFDVPLDYSKSSDKQIRIFCRSAEKLETPVLPAKKEKAEEQLPWLVYVQGGPGFGAPAPQDAGWTGLLLDKGYKILYFDHRGMGLSTPVTAATLQQQGTTQQQVDYLKLFRADSAVKDLEAIRKCLTAEYPAEEKKWSVMGQSYGGFVALNYLSRFPEGLREVFTFGGLAPISQRTPDEVVRRLYSKVEERNRKFYAKYPEDNMRVKAVIEFLREKGGVQMSDGGIMTPQRFMAMGLSLGAQGGFDRVHGAILRATNDLEIFGFLTRSTISRIAGLGMPFDEQPLYAVLHEAIYCQDQSSRWSFTRVRDEFPKFKIDSQDQELFFTGEVVFRDDFRTHSELKALVAVADALAEVSDWPELYDLEQLKRNEVPLYAATYVDDMYVDFGFAQETASLIQGCKTYITNAMYHDAIRSKMDDVMKSIFALRDDSID